MQDYNEETLDRRVREQSRLFTRGEEGGMWGQRKRRSQPVASHWVGNCPRAELQAPSFRHYQAPALPALRCFRYSLPGPCSSYTWRESIRGLGLSIYFFWSFMP